MPSKKTAGKPAKKNVGRPAKAKPAGRPAKKGTVRKSTKKPVTRKVASRSLEDKDVRVELSLAEPGVVRVLRRGLDLSKFYQYLDAASLGSGSKALTFVHLVTNESTDEWNDEGDGTRFVWMSGPVNFKSSITCDKREPGASEYPCSYPDRNAKSVWVRPWTEAERQRLVDAVGSQLKATFKFRKDGDSPALVEGEDIEWLKPCMLSIVSADLVEPY